MLHTHTCSQTHTDASRPAPCPPPFAQLLTSGVRHVFWLCCMLPRVARSETRPGSAEALGDYLCTELSEECPKPAAMGGLPPGLDLSQFPPDVQAQLAADLQMRGGAS